MVMPAPFAASSTDRNRTFRPDIEGLRAIAVMLVLLDLAGLYRFSGGYVGVDVLFVLCCFLITGLLLKEARETGGISIQRSNE
jgi:peptidoglycan/LPS O-acetylase OafA/YrhL